jgi:hypothetical protein
MEKPPMSEDATGGLGGGNGPAIRNTRLVERAIAEAWPIPEALRPRLIKRLAKITRDKTASPREITSAAKAILSASKINLESIATIIKAQEHEELVEDVKYLKGKLNK